MRLTITGNCPKCLNLVEAEFEIKSDGKTAEIDLEEIVKGDTLCSTCNQWNGMSALLKGLLNN